VAIFAETGKNFSGIAAGVANVTFYCQIDRENRVARILSIPRQNPN
jgi:hypothetical protein